MNRLLQRITIVEQTTQRLVLRELPILDWIVMGVLFAIALMLTVFGLAISGLVAVAVAILFALRSNIRFITFDAQEDTFSVVRRGVLRNEITEAVALDDIQHVYLKVDDNGFSQVIMVVLGEEHGLSAYSKEGDEWKEEIVVAINRFLNTRLETKQDREPSSQAEAELI